MEWMLTDEEIRQARNNWRKATNFPVSKSVAKAQHRKTIRKMGELNISQDIDDVLVISGDNWLQIYKESEGEDADTSQEC